MFGWKDMNNDYLLSISEEGKLKLPEFTRPTIDEPLFVVLYEDHIRLCGVTQISRRYKKFSENSHFISSPQTLRHQSPISPHPLVV